MDGDRENPYLQILHDYTACQSTIKNMALVQNFQVTSINLTQKVPAHITTPKL
jgi:hypothetical protein